MSNPGHIRWGVPQGSVIGPLLFICYTTPLQHIIESHGIECMMYADDTQLYISMKPDDRPQTMEKLESCLHDFRCWMRNNQLVLNDSKTELLHVSSPLRRIQELPPIHIGNTLISSSPTVRDLGSRVGQTSISSTPSKYDMSSCLTSPPQDWKDTTPSS